MRSRAPGVACMGAPERTGRAGSRERVTPPVPHTDRDALQSLAKDVDAPKGTEEDVERIPDTIRSSKRKNGFMLGLLEERGVHLS